MRARNPAVALLDVLWRVALRVAYRGLLAWWWLVRPERRGVHVALWCGDRVLFVRNSYRRSYTFPSGGVKSREDLRQAAARELREEVGIDLAPGDLAYVAEFLSYEEHKTDRSTVFEATVEVEPEIVPDRREVIGAGFVPVGAARELRLTSVVEQYLARWSESVGTTDPGEGAGTGGSGASA